MKRWLFAMVFMAVTPIVLPLAIVWCGFDIWRVYIEHMAEKVIGGLKE